jgi:hypothetical protein
VLLRPPKFGALAISLFSRTSRHAPLILPHRLDDRQRLTGGAGIRDSARTRLA